MSIRMVEGEMRTVRGTTNANARGGAEDRRRRKEWLVETYRADLDASVLRSFDAGDAACSPSRPSPSTGSSRAARAAPTGATTSGRRAGPATPRPAARWPDRGR